MIRVGVVESTAFKERVVLIRHKGEHGSGYFVEVEQTL
jgi:hypothetical protein